VENILSFYANYRHAKMASYNRETYQSGAKKIYVLFVFQQDDK